MKAPLRVVSFFDFPTMASNIIFLLPSFVMGDPLKVSQKGLLSTTIFKPSKRGSILRHPNLIFPYCGVYSFFLSPGLVEPGTKGHQPFRGLTIFETPLSSQNSIESMCLKFVGIGPLGAWPIVFFFQGPNVYPGILCWLAMLRCRSGMRSPWIYAAP